jgi:epoxyqueuosine reductase
VPERIRVITVRMNYLALRGGRPEATLSDPSLGYVSRYALGRDYHKVLRNRLQRLIDRMQSAFPGHRFRAFTDSAPVLEVALAAKSGLGWRGKHTLLLDRDAGSYFFLGEIYTDLGLPATRQPPPIAGAARAASTSARRRRSSGRTSSTRAAVSRT